MFEGRELKERRKEGWKGDRGAKKEKEENNKANAYCLSLGRMLPCRVPQAILCGSLWTTGEMAQRQLNTKSHMIVV